ncbi:uncharacterized protein [Miscanthus floridulus]|uniref:uncharacterized protein n=1 Tax=Miscanthus floridulus TaxID=154761 RepID=UPI003458384A
MADVSGGGDSSSSSGVRWQDEVDHELRPLVVKQLEATMAGLCRALHKDRSPPEGLNQYVAGFEEATFQKATDMIDYMKMISIRVSFGQKEAVQLKAAAAGRQQKMHKVDQMQRANMVQAIQGVHNSPLITTPQAVPMTASPSWPPFQSPNQHTACSVASNMNSNVNQGPSDMMAMLYQNFNSEPATVAPVAPGVQSSQRIMQSIAMQTESQSPAMHLQPTNIAQCHPASTVQLQGQQIARPNGYQNQLEQNVWDCVQHLLPTVQQEHFWITQQQVGMHMQRYQMLGANVGKMNTGYSGGWNNQQNAGWASGIQSPSKVCGQTNMYSHPISPAQSQTTVNKQSNLHCPLPPHESISQTRQNIVTTLAGQKTNSNQSQGGTSPCFSYKSPGLLQSSLTNDFVELCCTPSPISKFWVASPNESPKSRLQSPIAKQGLVAAGSPCVSVKSALTSAEKTGFEAAASPSTLVKTVSPSAIVKSGTVPADLPSDSHSSFLLHNNTAVNGCKQATTSKLSTPLPPADQARDQEHGRAETPVAQTPAPPADQAEDQEHGGAETPVAKTPAPPADQAEDQEHGGAETPMAKTPAPPADQAKDPEHGGAETPVAKKPIDRLIAAVLASSPAAIRSSFNLMKSAVIDMDSVPLPIGSNKTKRVYAVTSTSGSPTLCSTDDSTTTFESNASDAASSGYHNGKRQKPQNVKDALLDEIEAVNSRLIDTFISITSKDGADGTTSCSGMTLIKLSYTAVSLAPDLKSKFGVSGNFQPLVMPRTLSIPADYPRSSPVIVDDEGDARIRNKFSSISVAVDRAFRLALHNLQEPRSLKEIANVWDSCVRRAVTEYVYQLGAVDTNSSLSLCRGWVKG